MKGQQVAKSQCHKKGFLYGFLACVLVTPCLVTTFIPDVLSQSSQPKEIEGLVHIQDVDPTTVLDLRYATENNFTGKKIYSVEVGVLRQETAQKLAAASDTFRKDGYRIKIWDAYRPPSAQKIFWQLVPDERYVANPYRGGSRHNRGGAVDITLVNEDGEEIEMPSDFDDFSKRAAADNPFMTAQARLNADHMAKVMKKHGFSPYEFEWWHFDDNDWKDYPLVDVPFERFLSETKESVPVVPAVLKALKWEVNQAILVEEIPGVAAQAKLTAWQRQMDRWEPAFAPMVAAIGKNGFAPLEEKREGDGRTPAGVYWLRSAFGYLPKISTKLPYRRATDDDFWVDDPRSPQYNRWVRGQPQARSFERMKRDDDLYKYGIVIEYNTDPVVPGKGSAIFLHVWRDSDKPTSGCVALSEKNI